MLYRKANEITGGTLLCQVQRWSETKGNVHQSCWIKFIVLSCYYCYFLLCDNCKSNLYMCTYINKTKTSVSKVKATPCMFHKHDSHRPGFSYLLFWGCAFPVALCISSLVGVAALLKGAAHLSRSCLRRREAALPDLLVSSHCFSSSPGWLADRAFAFLFFVFACAHLLILLARTRTLHTC